jgi:hypothetical protein
VAGFEAASSGSGLFRHGVADVDEGIGYNPETNPASHAGVALIAAAGETVSTLDDADASLAPRSPFLAIAEPALLLFAFALRARHVSSTWLCKDFHIVF